MRVIQGSLKGRNIPVPKKMKARPTTDFAKESLFNILNNLYEFTEIEVLDLFGGSGNISYEFCSRGAKVVHLVDFNKEQIKIISKTAKEWDIPLKAIHIDVFEFIKISKQSYDVVFADPPYDMKGISDLPHLIFEKGLVNENGLLVVEHSKSTTFDHPFLKSTKKYGHVVFSFFENNTE